jgi:hypothetical protein
MPHSRPGSVASVGKPASQKPNNSPVETTSSITTKDAEMRVWAYGRNISRSNAGRVPLADGQAVADPLRGDAAIAHGRGNRRLGRKLDNFGLIGGFSHQATQAPPAICGPFCIAYLWQQILKSCLKRLRNPVNGRLSLRKSPSLRGAKRRNNLVGNWPTPTKSSVRPYIGCRQRA